MDSCHSTLNAMAAAVRDLASLLWFDDGLEEHARSEGTQFGWSIVDWMKQMEKEDDSASSPSQQSPRESTH